MNKTTLRLLMGELVPIENILSPEGRLTYCTEYTKLADKRRAVNAYELAGNIKLHKDKLGKQSSTFTSVFRIYTWARNNWIVTVSKKGIEFNVPVSTSEEEAFALWNEYIDMIGVG